MAAENSSWVYIGTYTSGPGKGIYVSKFNEATGELSAPELAAEAKDSSFLCVHPNGKFLYAVCETGRVGVASAFRIEKATGKLTLLNQQKTGGSGPCHLALDNTGKCLMVANYGSGSVAAFPVDENGKLGVTGSLIQHTGSSINPQRQAGPHAHFITADPKNHFALACDLGLDQVLVYRLDAKQAKLIPNIPPFTPIKAGEGPRHLAFHPNGKWVYVVSEIGSSVTALDYDAKRGTMKETQIISTLPDNTKGSACAEIWVHPSGKYVYASNRGHDSIAEFSVDKKTGKLTAIGYQSTDGKTPRHFAIDPSGKWLLAGNQDSDSVVVFGIDSQSGKLHAVGNKLAVPRPACLVFAK